jgi:hypothetical protein
MPVPQRSFTLKMFKLLQKAKMPASVLVLTIASWLIPQFCLSLAVVKLPKEPRKAQLFRVYGETSIAVACIFHNNCLPLNKTY